MNFGELKQRVRDQIGEPTDLDDEIIRWCGDAFRMVASEGTWPWDEKQTSFVARAVLNLTGDVTQGSNLIGNVAGSPSQSIVDEYVGGIVQIGGVERSTYVISAWNVLSSQITLDSEVTSATTAGAGLQIGQDLVSLPATVDTVLEVQDHEDNIPIQSYRERWTRFFPDPFQLQGGRPYAYSTFGKDLAGRVQLRFFPLPTEDRTYFLEYRQKPVVPDDTTLDNVDLEALTGIPDKFHMALVSYAIYAAKKFDFERAEQIPELAEFKDYMVKMRKYARTDAGRMYAMRARVNLSSGAASTAQQRYYTPDYYRYGGE